MLAWMAFLRMLIVAYLNDIAGSPIKGSNATSFTDYWNFSTVRLVTFLSCTQHGMVGFASQAFPIGEDRWTVAFGNVCELRTH